jgi:hypothetical protein
MAFRHGRVIFSAKTGITVRPKVAKMVNNRGVAAGSVVASKRPPRRLFGCLVERPFPKHTAGTRVVDYLLIDQEGAGAALRQQRSIYPFGVVRAEDGQSPV